MMRRHFVCLLFALCFLRFQVSSANGLLFGDINESCSIEEERSTAIHEQQQQCFSDEQHTNTQPTVRRKDDDDDDILSSFIQSPGKGQHLMLVPRNSPLSQIIRLTEDVASRLRQSQYIHNAAADDLMQVPPWEENKNTYQELSEILSSLKQQQQNASLFHTDIESLSNSNKKNQQQHQADVVRLELQSHPGYGIVPLSARDAGFMMLTQDNYMELGIGNDDPQAFLKIVVRPAETANQITTDVLGRRVTGRRFVLETPVSNDSNDRSIMMVGAEIMEGAPVTLMAVSSSSNSASTTSSSASVVMEDVDLADLYNDEHCQFVVHEDGSLSPAAMASPELVVGIAPLPPVQLVPRDSPHRLLFKYSQQFWSAPTPVHGVPLELKSSSPHHDNNLLAVVPMSRRPFESAGIMSLQRLGIGRKQDALHLYSIDNHQHHHFTLMNQPPAKRKSSGADTTTTSAVLVGMDLRVETGVPVLLLGYKANQTGSRVASFLREFVGTSTNATWIVNEEGSISPLNAPYLALGCEQLVNGGFISANNPLTATITQNQRLLAQLHATSTRPNTAADASIDESAHFLSSEMLRMVHIAVVVLFVEGTIWHFSFAFLLLAVVAIKIVPWHLWLVGLIRLCFGSTAALLCIGLQIAGAIMKTALDYWRKPKQQQVQRVDQRR